MVNYDAAAALSALPPGETDPNKLYIAVGRAIHAWESLEEALAALCLRLTGQKDGPASLAAFGYANRRFTERMAAFERAAEQYSGTLMNQAREAAFDAHFRSLYLAVLDMAIERHRIAHGHITMVGRLNPTFHEGRLVEFGGAMEYRWGAPFYSADNLRT